ncbi:MAG TPA: hypothetical protein PLR52_02950 [Bacteroidales bacterium]|nr:hypothetical protein [Bacteroidales bacterium]
MILVFSLILISSCKQNPYKVDVSSVDIDLGIKRFETDLFSIDPEKIGDNIPRLRDQYGSFLQLFSYVINAGEVGDTTFINYLLSFCTDKINNEVYNAVMASYPDVQWLEDGIEEAFRHYLWYFPGRNVPDVYTCITGFNNSMITLKDSVLAIGLDRYLGSDCDFYKRLNIYGYLALRMNSYNILPDCMYAWAKTQWNFEDMNYQIDNVLTEMIHEGKLRYFERCMLPGMADTLLLGFSSDQMRFCLNNEAQMWEYLVEHDLLFSTDQMVIRKLTGEAPFTSYFTSESPGRASVWIGFRIIESYMKHNPEITLEGLMNETDVQGLLGKSKYMPR